MSASTRMRVAADTSARPFSTRETVGTDTPACSAMVAIVARPGRCLPLVTIAILPGVRPKVTKPAAGPGYPGRDAAQRRRARAGASDGARGADHLPQP